MPDRDPLAAGADLVAGLQIWRSAGLSEGAWHELERAWDTVRRQRCVRLDGRAIGVLADQRASAGVNYLRLRPTAEEPDGGVWIRSVEAEVAPGGR